MRKYWPALVVVGLVLVCAPRSRAQDTTAKTDVTAEAAVGTSVDNMALVGAADSFGKGTESLVCFSKVTGAADSEIEHVWYKGETEVLRMKLAIKASPFRTWSKKRMPADRSGDWRCDVVHAGKVLQSVKFRVE